MSKTNDHSHEPATVMPAATTLMVADPNEPQPEPKIEILPEEIKESVPQPVSLTTFTHFDKIQDLPVK